MAAGERDGAGWGDCFATSGEMFLQAVEIDPDHVVGRA